MKKISLGFIGLLLAVSAVAQVKLNPDLLWSFKRISDPQTSPDGQWLLFSARSYSIAQNRGASFTYLVKLKDDIHKVLLDSTVNAAQARWRPDGKRIGFLSAKENGMQLWEINPDGTGLKRVTNIAGGINWYKYSPDMKHLAYGQDVKLDKEVKDIYPDLNKASGRIIDGLLYRHWDAWGDYTYAHIFISDYNENNFINTGKDIMEGERYDSPVKPFGGEEQIAWSMDGTCLAYTSKKLEGTEAAFSTNTDIYLYTLADNQTQKVSTGEGYDVEPAFSPDGKQLAWLSMERPGNESDKNRILVLDYATWLTAPATAATVDITKNMDTTVENFIWFPTGNKMYYTAVIEGTKQVMAYDFKDKKHSAITKGDHDYNQVIPWQNGKKWELIGVKTTHALPAALFKIGDKGEEKQVDNLNVSLLAGMKLAKTVKRWVPTTDGKKMLVWVVLPPNFDSTKKYPALLYCQGGPQSPVTQFFSYRWNFQVLAAAGYVVIAPNRRGLPGFGQKWNDDIKMDYGGQAMQDLLSATDNLANEPWIDKNRMGAIGASFGGYSVYWLAGHHQGRFKTFVAHCGMFNMESWWGATEEMFFAKDDNGNYWHDRDNFQNNSPHNFVKAWDAPILIIHNEKDFRVPVTEGMQAFTAAQTMGIPSRFLYFPDEGHWVMKPQNSVLWHRVFVNWLDKWLK